MSKKKIWKVKAAPEITRLNNRTGVRRRGGLVFSADPVYLEALPPEIEADAYLVKDEVSVSTMEELGGRITPLPASSLKAERVQNATETAAPATLEELSALKYQEQKSLAASLGVDTSGKGPELEARLAYHLGFEKPSGDEGAEEG